MRPGITLPISGPILIVAIGAGLTAVAALLGAFSHLPPGISFTVSALGIILFPGLVITGALKSRTEEYLTLPEHLATAFACGLVPILLLSFMGIVARTSLAFVILLLTLVYSALLILLIIRQVWLRKGTEVGTGLEGSRTAAIILIAAAILLGAATVWSPRDMDDWFYLAYIADYVDGLPINATDALMGPDLPSPPRVWFGSWWVTEALLSSVSGAHPVDAHQIYLPLIIFPFAIFGVFTLAKRILKSEKAAYFACFFQVLFYLSSAYPSDTAGWALFARTAQDKSFAFLVPVMVAIALGLGLVRRSHTHPEPTDRRLYALYFLSVIAAGLIHPMGVVWCTVGLIPFAAIELLRDRRRGPAVTIALVLVPLVLCSLMLGPGREATSLLEDVAPGPHEGRGVATLLSPYLPGDQARAAAGDRILSLSAGAYIAHPLLITRYPIALAGLVLTFAALGWWQRSRTARLLVALTAGVLFLAYVPGVAGFTSGIITRKMLYRLTWLLPWGITIGFFLTRIGLRLRWCYVIAIVITLALCRGDPRNYFSLMASTRDGGRPDPEFLEAAYALGAEPAPRGVVLATTNTGIMIPAYVRYAYPAYVSPAYSTIYRSERIRTPRDLRDFFALDVSEEDFAVTLEDFNCRYILARTTTSMAIKLEAREAEFRPVFANTKYGLWEVHGLEASGD
ncbi:MAG: DUF6077 domain-containing protein [bacterium]|jgi:hypothetical protein